MDSWALTDHGNGSGLAHARSAALKTQKAGKKYRQLYGVEFYFVPSLEEWQQSMDRHQQSIKDAKSAKEMQDRSEEPTVVKPPDEEDEQGAQARAGSDGHGAFGRVTRMAWRIGPRRGISSSPPGP
jgi:hypothetical protein